MSQSSLSTLSVVLAFCLPCGILGDMGVYELQETFASADCKGQRQSFVITRRSRSFLCKERACAGALDGAVSYRQSCHDGDWNTTGVEPPPLETESSYINYLGEGCPDQKVIRTIPIGPVYQYVGGVGGGACVPTVIDDQGTVVYGKLVDQGDGDMTMVTGCASSACEDCSINTNIPGQCEDAEFPTEDIKSYRGFPATNPPGGSDDSADPNPPGGSDDSAAPAVAALVTPMLACLLVGSSLQWFLL